MRLNVLKTGKSVHFYIIKSTYENGKHSSRIVEKLGTEQEIREKHPDCDPYDWARARLAEANRRESEARREIVARFSNARRISSGEQARFRGGYLFLQKMYCQLGLPAICRQISQRSHFDFNLNAILSTLVYTRILDPSSKRSSFEVAKEYLEPPAFDLHHIYRALSVLASENDYIQAQVYKNSKKLTRRRDKILFYDCTNYFFSIDQAEGLKQFGHGKQHQPNPIVGMGLFLDGSGFPLAFSLFPGNRNEQKTMKPLEEAIMKDFGMSKFIVPNDPKRLIKTLSCTEEGEIATRDISVLDLERIAEEEKFDGFYAVCSNFEATAEEIVAVSKNRWMIEDAFRTLKSEFDAGTVYLSRDDRITAHFMTCFLALLVYKLLEKAVRNYLPGKEPSQHELVDTLRHMDFHKIKGEGYIPSYTRTELTDALHEMAGFRTDFEIMTFSDMKKILNQSRK